MMKRPFTLAIISLIFIFSPKPSLFAEEFRPQLSLEKGDKIVYEITTEKNQQRNTNPNSGNSESFEITTVEKTQFQFIVEDKKEPGVYILAIKNLFRKSYSKNNMTGITIGSSDSRFPIFGKDIDQIIDSYMNSIQLRVLFNTNTHDFSVLNIVHIKSGLTSYIESRGVPIDQDILLKCERKIDEKVLLRNLSILNIYPGHQEEKEYSIQQPDGNREDFLLKSSSDSTCLLRSEIKDYYTLNTDGTKQKGFRLPRDLTVDKKTGLLLLAESIPKKVQNEPAPIREKRIMSMSGYYYTARLVRYSKWENNTIICGRMRFNFDYVFQIDMEIDIYNTMIPTMMLQPLVENAILHGLAPKRDSRKLILRAKLEKDHILFQVEDNGLGREAASSHKTVHSGKGLQIIQSRIDILNRTGTEKFYFEISDLKDREENSVGTLANLIVPDEK